ncbi:MAG: hypothetical protein R3325_10995 [Thermoanaerobaculia bacterium]|nr:hypothetical protein [Thermoanaerobaculia bacterium]
MSRRSRRVLVVGQIPDPHIERVEEGLDARGADSLVLDCFQEDHFLDLELKDGRPGGRVEAAGVVWDLGSVDAVWWRWKPVRACEWSGAFASVAERFRSDEWRAGLRSLPRFTPRAEWINPLWDHRIASGKAFQLALAAAVGLGVPDTHFTNDARRAASLFGDGRRVVYKTLSSFLVPPDEIIFTNEVDESDVRRSGEQIRQAPGIFQRLVEKRHELRVTIVDQQVFAVRIDSQMSPITAGDWRRDQFQKMYGEAELAPVLRERLLEFQRRAGIRFGAYDLIVEPSGAPVFLECNPAGQWLWLELELGLPISAAVADALAGSR